MRRRPPYLLFILCAIAAFAFPAGMRAELWVSGAGSDSNDGSQAHPFRTITHAMAVANPSFGIEQIVVSRGLEGGEVVVTAGVHALRPGQKVSLLKPSP